jgi:hypothetical protein
VGNPLRTAFGKDGLMLEEEFVANRASLAKMGASSILNKGYYCILRPTSDWGSRDEPALAVFEWVARL